MEAEVLQDGRYRLFFDSAEGPQQVLASILIGCEGIHSPTRRLLVVPLVFGGSSQSQSKGTERPAEVLHLDERTPSKWVIGAGHPAVTGKRHYLVAGRKGLVIGAPEFTGAVKWTLFLGPAATAEDGIDPEVWQMPVAEPTAEQIGNASCKDQLFDTSER